MEAMLVEKCRSVTRGRRNQWGEFLCYIYRTVTITIIVFIDKLAAVSNNKTRRYKFDDLIERTSWQLDRRLLILQLTLRSGRLTIEI